MTKKDLWLGLVIGAGVGLFIQPVLTSTNAVVYLDSLLPGPASVVRIFVFLFFVILAPLALAIAWFLNRFVRFIYQVAKFAAVGSLNSFIDLGIFNLLGLLLGQPLGGTLKYGILKSISFLTATTNSYFWNKAWTFGDKSEHRAQKVITFYLVTLFNWAVNVGVATGISALPPMLVPERVWLNVVAPVVGIFAGMAGNFLGYKFIVFREKKAADVPPTV